MIAILGIQHQNRQIHCHTCIDDQPSKKCTDTNPTLLVLAQVSQRRGTPEMTHNLKSLFLEREVNSFASSDKEKDEPSSVFWKRPAMVAVSKWALSLRWWWTMLLNWGCFLEGITFAIPEIHKHDKRITFVQFLQYFAEWLLTRWQLSDLRTTFVLGLSDHVSWSTDSDCRKVIVKCNKRYAS